MAEFKRYYSLIQPDEVMELLEGDDPVIVDCRFDLRDTTWGRDQYRKSHVPGAYYAHLDEDLSSGIIPGRTGRHPLPAKHDLATLLGSWGLTPERQLIAYDQANGAFAARLWWLARYAGHEAVAVIDGGWRAWVAAGLDQSSSTRALAEDTYKLDIQGDMLFSARDVLGLIERGKGGLIDCRAAERYLGEKEPIDPVAGHIPTAMNIPYKDNVHMDGSWKDREMLKARLEPYVSRKSEPVVMYCGSGVTACHNVLAAYHAGLGMPALYAGSWSEWITDPARPVTKGQEEPPNAGGQGHE